MVFLEKADRSAFGVSSTERTTETHIDRRVVWVVDGLTSTNLCYRLKTGHGQGRLRERVLQLQARAYRHHSQRGSARPSQPMMPSY